MHNTLVTFYSSTLHHKYSVYNLPLFYTEYCQVDAVYSQGMVHNNPSAMTYEFTQVVKSLGVGLLGCTEEPCWEGLLLGLEQLIKQDLLHGSYKFMWDHLVKWLIGTLGGDEIDS